MYICRNWQKDIFKFQKNIFIGVVYRPPNTNPIYVAVNFKSTLEKLSRENKCSYLPGDYNMDLIKTPIADILDLFYSFSFLPLITRPTRVTRTSATSIDNIFTNHLTANQRITNGILFTTISNHFPIFHFTDNIDRRKTCNSIMKIKINEQTLDTFRTQLFQINYEALVLSEDDSQLAYDKFHSGHYSLYKESYTKRL